MVSSKEKGQHYRRICTQWDQRGGHIWEQVVLCIQNMMYMKEPRLQLCWNGRPEVVHRCPHILSSSPPSMKQSKCLEDKSRNDDKGGDHWEIKISLKLERDWNRASSRWIIRSNFTSLRVISSFQEAVYKVLEIIIFCVFSPAKEENSKSKRTDFGFQLGTTALSLDPACS